MPLPRLASLDNQVTFKKSFSDREVLETFVEDVTGEPFRAGKIETEKQFKPIVGKIDVRFDIFAESEDGRAIIEMQRVRYESHFDRFLHYFLTGIIEQVDSAKDYAASRRVYTIVLLTAPYRRHDRTGRMIEDSMLISRLDPRTLEDMARDIFGHQLIFLNPRHPYGHLPRPIREWLDLILLSMEEPELQEPGEARERQLGTHRPAVLKAAGLCTWDGMTSAERAKFIDAKDVEQTTATLQEERDAEIRQKEEALHQREEALRQREEAFRQREEALLRENEALRQKDEERRQKEAALEEIQRLRELLGARRDEAP